ncbi:uncharacterized protein LOC114124448 isoform X1 [Aphis gossypii]|uniref:uncharacterized protein LOC114124448 isoform X1 n=1 Tax=Aphis gossypii TaxID=80765 RepID=UPI002158DA3F|nr:uncharacterized protein LOC114124448 isoform X1 [Aphis gossypii]
MASVASLLMLLAVAFPIIHSIPNHSAQDTFPHGKPTQETPAQETPTQETPAQTENSYQLCINDEAGVIPQTCCPPLGSSDDRFNVTVLGNPSSTIIGSAYMKRYHPEYQPAFNLWLADFDTEIEDIDIENITHAVFYCFSKRRFIDEDKNIDGWYVTLKEPFEKWFGRSTFYCALYSMIQEYPPTIQMVISANNSCDGLAATMANIEQQRVPEGLQHFEDGSIALLLTQDIP